jgi:hypothetical protein
MIALKQWPRVGPYDEIMRFEFKFILVKEHTCKSIR